MNAEYGGLKEVMPLLETAATTHAQCTFRCDKTVRTILSTCYSYNDILIVHIYVIRMTYTGVSD